MAASSPWELVVFSEAVVSEAQLLKLEAEVFLRLHLAEAEHSDVEHFYV